MNQLPALAIIERARTATRAAASILFGLLIGLAGSPALAQPAIDSGRSKGDAPVLSSTPTSTPPGPLSVRAVADRTRVEPGGRLAIAVEFDMAEGFHTWPPEEPIEHEALPGWQSIPTAIAIESPPSSVVVGPVQWPETHEVTSGALGQTLTLPMYEGRQVAYIPIVVKQDAEPGPLSLTISFRYQMCDDSSCLMPETLGLPVELEVVPLEEVGTAPDDASPAEPRGEATDLFADFDGSVFARRSEWSEEVAPSPSESAGPDRSFFGIPVPEGDSAAGLAILAALAALGGFILNLTPCVLPVIPIKVMTISQHAGSPGKSLMLGLWMAAGVVVFWFGIGLPVAFLSSVTDPSQLFGLWYVTLGIGVIIAAMGVGIMGLFQITLPQSVYMVNPKADTPAGSFMFGVMTAVLGLPCFGFVAGALLAGAATLPTATILTIFAALGAGMALPYLVLAAKPSWVDKLPRTGPGSELVKQVMGLLMLAAAAFFIGAGVLAFVGGRPAIATALPWWGKIVHWWFIALFVAAAGGWLIWRAARITKKTAPRVLLGVVGLIATASSVAIAAGMTHRAHEDFWVPYSEQALAEAIESGSVVVLDFTAEWCVNCKTLEATVLDKQPVKGELLSPGVVAMQADNTSDAAPGWDKMRELGQTGIPLLVVYGPGLEKPWQSNAYTSSMVMRAIERARGDRPRAASENADSSDRSG